VKLNVHVVVPALVTHDGAAPDDPANTNTATEPATTSPASPNRTPKPLARITAPPVLSGFACRANMVDQ
jgi:hypothetical protein